MGKAAKVNKKRKKMLRDLEFTSYDPSTKDEFGFAPAVSRAWMLYYQAVGSAPAGSVEQTAKGVSIFKKLKETSEKGETEGSRRLKKSGAKLRLTNEELEYSKQMLGKLRDNIPVSQGDALMLLDELLSTAKEIDEAKLITPPEAKGPELVKEK